MFKQSETLYQRRRINGKLIDLWLNYLLLMKRRF